MVWVLFEVGFDCVLMFANSEISSFVASWMSACNLEEMYFVFRCEVVEKSDPLAWFNFFGLFGLVSFILCFSMIVYWVCMWNDYLYVVRIEWWQWNEIGFSWCLMMCV